MVRVLWPRMTLGQLSNNPGQHISSRMPLLQYLIPSESGSSSLEEPYSLNPVASCCWHDVRIVNPAPKRAPAVFVQSLALACNEVNLDVQLLSRWRRGQ